MSLSLDELKSVPSLQPSGENWTIFAIRLEAAVRAKRVWDHFDGSSTRPEAAAAVPPTIRPSAQSFGPLGWPNLGLTGSAPAPQPPPVAPEGIQTRSGRGRGRGRGAATAPPPQPEPPIESLPPLPPSPGVPPADDDDDDDLTLSICQDAWDKDEDTANYLLTSKLPDTTIVRILTCRTIAEKWRLVVQEYTDKSMFAQTSLKNEFMESKCPKGANVKQFLNELRLKKQTLAACGVTIDDDAYRSTIINSIPPGLAKYASTQVSAAEVAASHAISFYGGQISQETIRKIRAIDPDALIHLISVESERESKERERRKTDQKRDTKGKEVSLIAEERPRKETRTCRYCHKPGHIVKNCKKLKERKDQSYSGPKREMNNSPPETEKPKSKDGNMKESANVTVDSEDESDWCAAVDEDVEEGVECPPGFEDWFDKDKNDYPMVELSAKVTEDTPEEEERISQVIIDSGSTRHLSPNKSDFISFRTVPPKLLRAANRQPFHTVGEGTIEIELPNGDSASKVQLKDVWYSPRVTSTLISVGRLDSMGHESTFGNGKCIIIDPEGRKIADIPRTERGLYRFNVDSATYLINDEDERQKLTVDQLHARLGHISPKSATQLITKGLVEGIQLDQSVPAPKTCDSCLYGRATRFQITKARSSKLAENFGDEIHTDLWGPSPVQSIGGKRYYVSFTDDATRFTYLAIIRSKRDAFDSYKMFAKWAEMQHGVKIKRLHSDRGGEFTGKDFVEFLKSQGTEQKLTVHDTPEHNGVAERVNRTIGKKMRSMLHSSILPKNLWSECCKHAAWLKNRVVTRPLGNKTPYEALYGKKPFLKGLPEWGSRVWVHDTSGSKLDKRVREGRWVGYDSALNGSRIYWPENKSLTVERSVYFSPSDVKSIRLEREEEKETPSEKNKNEEKETYKSKTIVDEDNENSSKCIKKPSPYVRRVLAGEGSDRSLPRGMHAAVAAAADVIDERVDDYDEEYAFMATMDDRLWEQAMKEEIHALESAGTWEKRDHVPKGTNIVGSKWVFKVKKDAAGKSIRYKARLVAQGFSQVPGVDFFETYAPVAKLSTIRAVLAMAALYDLELEQIDVKSAYLNGHFDDGEDIFMRPPPGYARSKTEVYELKKPIYGLKQSG
ncbi:hypothetical protein ACEPAI_2819 [Sanghuangporus weigelae]